MTGIERSSAKRSGLSRAAAATAAPWPRVSCEARRPDRLPDRRPHLSIRASTEEAAALGDLLRRDDLDRVTVEPEPGDQPRDFGLILVEDAPGHQLAGDIPA